MTKMSDTPQDRSADGVPEVEQMSRRVTSRAEQQAYNLLHTGGLTAFDARYGATASTAINAWADQGKIKVRHTPTGMTVQTFKKYANNDLEVREQCGNPAAHESHIWEDPAPRGGGRWCSGVPEVEQEPVVQYSAQLGHYMQQDDAGFWHKAITPAEQRTGVSDVQASIADEVAALRLVVKQRYGMSTTARLDIVDRLDRIAALVPQRATDGDGSRLAWQHDCGQVAYGLGVPPFCPTCRIEQAQASDWRALYTVAGH